MIDMTDILPLALPFIFSFIIVYGALEFTGTFSRRVNSVIAAVIALFAMTVPQVSGLINSALPYAVIFFIAVFFLALIATFFRKIKGPGGQEPRSKARRLELWIMILGLALLILATQTEFIENLLPNTQDTVETFVIGAGILIILTLLYWAFSRGSEQ